MKLSEVKSTIDEMNEKDSMAIVSLVKSTMSEKEVDAIKRLKIRIEVRTELLNSLEDM